MNIPQKILSLLVGASLFTLTSLSAITTDPVGYVTVTVAAGTDAKFSIPLQKSPVFSSAVGSVSTGQIDVSGTVPDITTTPHIVIVTTDGGTLEGNWYEVSSSTATSITVFDDIESDGLTSSDSIKVVPVWTLDTLFPSGGDIPASSDVTNPVAYVFTNPSAITGINLSSDKSYIYHSGEQGLAGWYDANNLGGGSQGDVALYPDTYITVRNLTGSDASVVLAGSVPADTLATDVLSASFEADNQVVNPFPAGLTLADSNLYLASGGPLGGSADVTNPSDQLLIYEGAATSLNPSTTKTIIYHTGEQGLAGYYDANNLGGGTQENYVIPANAALIIRKGASSAGVTKWRPNLPYTL